MEKIHPAIQRRYGLQGKTPAATLNSEKKNEEKIHPAIQKRNQQKEEPIRKVTEYLQNKPTQPEQMKTSQPVKIGVGSVRQEVGKQLFPYVDTFQSDVKQKANSMPSYMQGTRSAEVKAEKAWADVMAGQQQVDSLKTKVAEVEQTGAKLEKTARELSSAKMGLDNLYAQYQQNGDETIGQAYLIAAEEYNKKAEAYRKEYAAYEKTTGVVAEYNKAVMDLQLKNSAFSLAQEEYQKTVKEAKAEEKKQVEETGVWGSDLVEFIDRSLAASQAGQMDWFAGMATIDRKLGNGLLAATSGILNGVAKITGSQELEKKAWELRVKSRSKSREAEDAKKASAEFMEQALEGTGMVDGWIVKQMESVGAMMMDTFAVGTISANATVGLPTKVTGTKVLGLRAAGSAMQEAQDKGYGEFEQLLYGAASGSLEMISEKLFGGNPLYDTDKGVVNQLVDIVIKNPKVLRLLYSKGFDIMGEGLEEVFVSFLEPVVEYGTTRKNKINWASGEELGQAFLGGVFLGLVGQGTSAVANAVGNRTVKQAYNELGKGLTEKEAVQAVVEEGLQADPITDAYQNAVKLQKKLDSGEEVTAKEVGKQLMENQKAIEAGKLVH